MDGRIPEFLRLLFTTPLGETKAVEIASDRLGEISNSGVCFDGSSVKGYAKVNNSDLVLKLRGEPIYETWDKDMALALCRVYDTDDIPHRLDTITVLERVISNAREMGFRFMVGGELEFFLVRELGKSGIIPADSGGYYAAPPSDRGLSIRRDVSMTLRRMGLHTTVHHHEVARGQHEIGLKFCDVMELADAILVARASIAERAIRDGLIATFMPKPFAKENGSGLHIHQSLWDLKGENNLFSGEDGALSKTAEHFAAGLLRHASGLAALVAPTVNSYKRLRPGFEAPTQIAWGPMNRTTMIRIPHYMGNHKNARIELRCPDSSCSPHLALAAILAAGLDGVENELEPPSPRDDDLFESQEGARQLPPSLSIAISELESDSVLREVLGEELIEWITRMRLNEWRDYVSVTGDPGPMQVTSWEIDRYLLAM
ncbi:glutamine synthetase [Candidatus Thorarchaeota archaeon]|nr:MAG: glutamine synthetase [Candidatus Thorarchaeota archaeon]